jgi:hypothetical protein
MFGSLYAIAFFQKIIGGATCPLQVMESKIGKRRTGIEEEKKYLRI